MPQFYRPDPNNPQVYDASGRALDFNAYKAAGGVATNPNTEFADVAYAPLPTLNGGQNTSLPSLAPKVDPVNQFNLNLMELLTRAQRANSGNSALLGEQERLQRLQTGNSMAPASQLGIEGLAPGDMMAARGNEASLYNPEIKSLAGRQQMNNEAIQRFEGAINAAGKYGEALAKTIKPDEETIAAVKAQLKAGVNVSADVMERVGKFLTIDDWAEIGATDSKTADIEEYEYAKSQGYKGSLQQWKDRPSANNGSKSDPGYTPTEKRAKERAKLNDDNALNFFINTPGEFQDLWIQNVTPLNDESFGYQDVVENYNSWKAMKERDKKPDSNAALDDLINKHLGQ